MDGSPRLAVDGSFFLAVDIEDFFAAEGEGLVRLSRATEPGPRSGMSLAAFPVTLETSTKTDSKTMRRGRMDDWLFFASAKGAIDMLRVEPSGHRALVVKFGRSGY